VNDARWSIERDWRIERDDRGVYAHDATGPSWARVSGRELHIKTHDGGCTLPLGVLMRLVTAEATDQNLCCSFCGKGQVDVGRLIAGPTVYICDECAALVNEILAEELTERAADERSAREKHEDDVRIYRLAVVTARRALELALLEVDKEVKRP